MTSLDQGSAAAPVRHLASRDVQNIAAVLARAFFDDPLFRWMFPRDDRRLRQTQRHFARRTRALLAQEESYTTASAAAGAALWARPDEWREPPVSALWQIATLAPVIGTRLPSVLRALNEVEVRHPASPHWYLAVLGTAPEHQGRGIASALLAPVLKRCDVEGTAAYLETARESNTRFYARHGFEVTDRIVLRGGPQIWMMWRAPLPAAGISYSPPPPR
ncbi:MAG: GNAT family N-acetyltransferase [Thermoleophilaceae bacterium]